MPAPIDAEVSALRYGHDYREDVQLHDGRTVRLVALAPAHAAELARGYELLSQRSRYLRFLTVQPALSSPQLRYLTELDGYDHFALAALLEVDGQWRGVAVGRFVRVREPNRASGHPHGPDGKDAEVAVTVVDDYQRLGIASALLERLVSAARERGYAHFVATMLTENRAAHALLSRFAPVRSTRRSGYVVESRFALDAVGAHAAA